MRKPYEIVIPLYNDEENLVNLLDSLINVGVRTSDVIVSMSGPRGNIDDIKERYGFFLLYSNTKQNPSRTRNKGATQVKADYIAFLDSDVLVTKEWKEALDEISTQKSVRLTGDTVHISKSPNWLERYWFDRIERSNRRYINSANILVESAFFFEVLKGFNVSLDSGEDYDFSSRAADSGTPPLLDPRLKVFHEGYPKSVKEFVKRERWHASGDLGSLNAYLKSKVMIAATLYISLAAIAVISVVITWWLGFLLSTAGLFLLPLALTIFKMGWSSKSTFISALVMNLYLAGRGAALIGALSRPLTKLLNRDRV